MQRFYIIYINQFDFVWKSRVRKQIVQTKGTEAHTNAPRLGSQNHRSLRISIPAFATLKIGLFSSPCGRGVEQSRQRSPVQASGIFQLPTNSSQLQAGKQIIKSKRKEKKRKFFPAAEIPAAVESSSHSRSRRASEAPEVRGPRRAAVRWEGRRTRAPREIRSG
jgi:hypothetical protein